MGLGSTAKKLQTVVEMADELYAKLGELREQIAEMRSAIETTNDRVEHMEAELADQRALLEAMAEHQGVEIPDDAAASADETSEDEADAGTDSTTASADTPTPPTDGDD